jgi:hypothetical protein
MSDETRPLSSLVGHPTPRVRQERSAADVIHVLASGGKDLNRGCLTALLHGSRGTLVSSRVGFRPKGSRE